METPIVYIMQSVPRHGEIMFSTATEILFRTILVKILFHFWKNCSMSDLPIIKPSEVDFDDIIISQHLAICPTAGP